MKVLKTIRKTLFLGMAAAVGIFIGPKLNISEEDMRPEKIKERIVRNFNYLRIWHEDRNGKGTFNKDISEYLNETGEKL